METMDMTVTGCRLVAVFQRGSTEFKVYHDSWEDEYTVRRIDIPTGDLLVEDEDLDRELYSEAYDDESALKIVFAHTALEAKIFP